MEPVEAVPRQAVPIIRPLLLGDVPAAHAIYSHYVLHSIATFEEIAPSEAEHARRLEEILRAGLPYLAAELDGRVVGYAYASPYRTRSAYRFSVEDSIYVHPEMAGHGIGRALLGALIAQCNAGPWEQMIAVIADSGSAASIRLHASFGFQHAGRLTSVGYKLGVWVDTVFMQLALK